MDYGWYRHNLSLLKKDINKHITLDFDGIFQDAEVYVNDIFLR
jgi:hypothetical protein